MLAIDPKHVYKGVLGHVSRTEFKILQEDPNWLAVMKPSKQHSDMGQLVRGASTFKPVHRLDFETQGVLLLAKEDIWEPYHELFLSGKALKIYLAGAPENSRLIGFHKGFVGSRYRSSSKTKYVKEEEALKSFHSTQEAEHIVKKSNENVPFFGKVYEINLITGRRHQIRSFFASLGSPLIGDELYGDSSGRKTLELLSWKLSFDDPVTKQTVSIVAPIDLVRVTE